MIGRKANMRVLWKRSGRVAQTACYEYEGLHPDLEEALLKWRRKAAASRNVPAYYIMHQRVLLGIADAAPQSEEELLALAGVGPMLLSRYGSEILAITRTV